MSTATWVCFIHADQLHQETDNDSVSARQNLLHEHQHPALDQLRSAPVSAPVHRSEPGPDFVDTQHAMELSECIGRVWGLVSEADDEHEPCLPSGGGESDGRGGRRDSVGRIRRSVGP
jgi:hypothetical protein